VDWSNERYVRIYTRDTETVLLQSWQARHIFREMCRKCDRAGVIECRTGVRGLAVILNMASDADVVATHLPELLADGSVREIAAGYFLPNFVDAQEAPQSDKLRAKESRERRRDLHKAASIVEKRNLDTKAEAEPPTVTKRTTESHNEASRHETNEIVTRGHTASHGVTPSVPSRAVLRRATPSRAVPAGAETAPASLPGRTQLLNALQPSQRKAMADTLNVYAQGYQLPTGIGIPTAAQIDQACLECLASIPVHDIRPNRVRNFLVAVMRPNERSTETRTAGSVANNVLDRLKAMSEGKP
jgi:hypothetical protein